MASVFTQIINGDLPGHFIYRDEICVVIMTIAPTTAGHVLLIPCEEVDHWDDLNHDQLCHLMKVSQAVAKSLKSVYRPKRVAAIIAGIEVPHTHLHLIPINEMEDMNFSKVNMVDASLLKIEAEKIRAAIKFDNI